MEPKFWVLTLISIKKKELTYSEKRGRKLLVGTFFMVQTGARKVVDKRVHLFISGRVQGVFFRDTTKRKADELGLSGWVRNLPDGRVETICEGDESKVDKFIKWCYEGPSMARVDNVEQNVEEYTGQFDSFQFRW